MGCISGMAVETGCASNIFSIKTAKKTFPVKCTAQVKQNETQVFSRYVQFI